jgi:hypothetical protein
MIILATEIQPTKRPKLFARLYARVVRATPEVQGKKTLGYTDWTNIKGNPGSQPLQPLSAWTVLVFILSKLSQTVYTLRVGLCGFPSYGICFSCLALHHTHRSFRATILLLCL